MSYNLPPRHPRSRYGAPRISVSHLSFPRRSSIYLLGAGSFATELSRSVPEDALLKIVRMMDEGPHLQGRQRFGLPTLRSILKDAEAAALHWAADFSLPAAAPIADDILQVLSSLYAMMQKAKELSGKDARTLRTLLAYTVPDLVDVPREIDQVDLDLLQFFLPEKRKKKKERAGDRRTNCFIDFLLDDWVRWTKRPLTQHKGPGSAYYMVYEVLNVLIENVNPRASLLHAFIATELPGLKRSVEAPLWNAIRVATENHPDDPATKRDGLS